MDALKELKNLDRDTVLRALGLEAKRDPVDVVAPLLGVFGAGMLIGAGLGLLFAPKPGRKLRQELGRHVRDATDRATEALESVQR